MKTALVFVLLLVFAASEAGVYREDIPKREYVALANEPQFDCVGMVMDNAAAVEHGSCVLINKRYVLSAAHVFVTEKANYDTMIVNGVKMKVEKIIGKSAGEAADYLIRFNRRLYRVKAIHIYPDNLDASTHGACDLALLELEDTVEGVHPAPLCETYDELGSVITGVGYGASGQANKAEDVGIYMEKIAGQNTIDKIDGYEVDGKGSRLWCDFDHPTYKDCNKMGSAEPLRLEYICAGGDSGGGFFRKTKAGWELTGIIAGGGIGDIDKFLRVGYYGQTMHATRISPFVSWIRSYK